MFVKAVLRKEADAFQKFSLWLNGRNFYDTLSQPLIDLALGKNQENAKETLREQVAKGDLEAIKQMYDPDISNELTKLGFNSVEYADNMLVVELNNCKIIRKNTWLSEVFVQDDKILVFPKSYEARKFEALTLILKTYSFKDFYNLGRKDPTELYSLKEVIKDQIRHILGETEMAVQFYSNSCSDEETLIHLDKDISTNSGWTKFEPFQQFPLRIFP